MQISDSTMPPALWSKAVSCKDASTAEQLLEDIETHIGKTHPLILRSYGLLLQNYRTTNYSLTFCS